MAFGAGLGSFGSGVIQGVDQGQNIRAKAMQIQQAQLALDQAKKQVAADAAAFSGIPGAQAFSQPGAGGAQQAPMGLPGPQMPPPPPQTAQPMPPGQPSQPAVPPSPGQAMSPPPAAGQPAPPPQPGGGGSLPQQGQQPGPGGLDPTDPRAAVQVVMSIAQEIKSRNPNIDPYTLSLATSRVIDMSKGLAPALRQGAQVVVQNLRDAAAQQRTDTQVQGRADVGAAHDATISGDTDRRIGAQRDIAAGHDTAAMDRARLQASSAMERTQASLQAANQRAASGVWSKEKLAAYTERAKAAQLKISTAQKQLSSLQSALVSGDDARAQQAQKALQAGITELDRVNKAAGLDAAGGAPAGAGAASAVTGARGPAPATLKGKPIWPGPDGKGWVFEDGTEAK